MRKGIIIIISLFIVQTINSQTISKKDFLNTEWFSENTDSIFFCSDTIRLIKYSNIYDQGKGYKIYYESGPLNDSESVKFQFKRHRNLNFWVINYHWSSIAKIGERKWEIKNNELVTYKNGLKEWIFRPVSKIQIEFENKNQKFKTTELIMIKRNN